MGVKAPTTTYLGGLERNLTLTCRTHGGLQLGAAAKEIEAKTHRPAPAPRPAPTSSSAPVSSSTPAPPAPTQAAPSCYPLTNGGNCYRPGEYCRNSDHGMHGVAGDGEAIVCEDNDGWRWDPA